MKSELQKKLLEEYRQFFTTERKIYTGENPTLEEVHELLNQKEIVLPIQFGVECFPKGSLILGEENKNIEYFDISNNLFGEHNIQKILNKFEKEYNGKLIKIEASGILPLYTTPEHPILTVTSNCKYRPEKIIFNYKKASDITPKIRHKKGGDYLSIPILTGTDETTILDITKFRKEQKSGVLKTNSISLLDEDIAWFFGLYVAEGSISNNGIQISLHVDEIDIINKVEAIFNKLGYSVFVAKQRKTKCVVLTISCKTLSRAFNLWCGHLAKNKQIPSFILNNSNLNILKKFLDGYIEGDGSKYNSYGEIIGVKASTVSKILATQLQLAYAKFGKFARICVKKGGINIIMNRKCNTLTKYFISVNYNNNKDILIKNDKIIIPVRKKNEISFNGLVYNFTTEDNTYLVNNIIVHNCGDGWFMLLQQLLRSIESHLNPENSWPRKERIPLQIDQIKEKFGGLRFYYHGGDNDVRGMINLAERLSYSICEECGSTKNVSQTKGWIITLCEDCMKKHNKNGLEIDS